MNNIETLEAGKYQHYKGKFYDVIGVGKDTETEEDVVVYCPLYDSDVTYWVRPLTMFRETVIVDGVSIPRFQKVNHGE